MFAAQPDLQRIQTRMQAFWGHGVTDRPLVQFDLLKPIEERLALPPSHHSTSAERWMDADYQAQVALVEQANREYVGDNFPIAWPNLGPDVFAALLGAPLTFGDYGTSWSEPILKSWEDAERLHLDLENPYCHKLSEMTDALLAVSRGRLVVGLSDFHGGADCLAALRGPETLAVDLIDHPAEVKALLDRIMDWYFQVYDLFYEKLTAAGQPCTTWTPLLSTGKYYLPSNDFSGLVSPGMYAEFFQPLLKQECRFLDHSMYHLDGPGALRHLDLILQFPDLDAVQYVPPPSDTRFATWAWVYQRIQQAGKSLQVTCRLDEIGEIIQALRPAGLYLMVHEVPSKAEAEHALTILEQWCRHPGS
jgi:hypothetical protein